MWQQGSIFSLEKQYVQRGFYLDFTYFTSGADTLGAADGLAFVIQDNQGDSTIPRQQFTLGSTGIFLFLSIFYYFFKINFCIFVDHRL